MTERRLLLAGAALAAAMALAGIGGARAFATPSLSSLPKGPVLAHAIERGKLIVGVRRYPRPAPPEAPTPPEPDAFDATLARQLAASLGIPLELVGLDPAVQEAALREGRVDLLVAGVPASSAAQDIASAPGSYDTGRGLVVALRRGKVQDEAALRGASVCVGEGSGYAGAVSQRYGAQPRSYPSSVHAASAFMAGECAALAEDGEVLERLMQNNKEWRFYKPLASDVRLPSDAAIRLADGDAASRDYLAAALRQWRSDGTLAKARDARAGNLQFEITLLKDGFVCHS
ncbi:polar amino acid transport system substrate-binding protein [Variovorax boronicumulans]|uniref:transporter substrate-binding domain-containing protein n=1 Tax=Variovorax boronicumulans TaxID=436515 RepID=UPI0024732BA2|nr:transporter substrate-binding domain-containing protein [Variovorax boronicumulans]MDH6169918.1 polar amino acid transport system substrate-binding protein [Variovorax boronicumulans]